MKDKHKHEVAAASGRAVQRAGTAKGKVLSYLERASGERETILVVVVALDLESIVVLALQIFAGGFVAGVCRVALAACEATDKKNLHVAATRITRLLQDRKAKARPDLTQRRRIRQ